MAPECPNIQQSSYWDYASFVNSQHCWRERQWFSLDAALQLRRDAIPFWHQSEHLAILPYSARQWALA